MKIRKTVQKYIDIIASGTLTENEIRAFRKNVNGSSTFSASEQHTLLSHFIANAPYNITPEQTKKGIEYLKRVTFKLNGDLRKNAPPFGSHEIDVLESFKSFEFIGLQNISQNCYANYMPIYRVNSTKGASFDYVAGSFGQIEVIG